MANIAIKDIPAAALEEVAFMLGDVFESKYFLADIIKRHGWPEENFGYIDVNEDEALTVEVYEWLLANGATF